MVRMKRAQLGSATIDQRFLASGDRFGKRLKSRPHDFCLLKAETPFLMPRKHEPVGVLLDSVVMPFGTRIADNEQRMSDPGANAQRPREGEKRLSVSLFGLTILV